MDWLFGKEKKNEEKKVSEEKKNEEKNENSEEMKVFKEKIEEIDIFKAAKDGDLNKVREYLRKGGYINKKNEVFNLFYIF